MGDTLGDERVLSDLEDKGEKIGGTLNCAALKDGTVLIGEGEDDAGSVFFFRKNLIVGRRRLKNIYSI